VEYCPAAEIQRGKMTDIHAIGGRISGITVALDNGDTQFISTPHVVLCPGPMLQSTMDILYQKGLLGIQVPIHHELHARVIFDDPKQITTSTSPLTFDMDPFDELPVRINLWHYCI
jgi:hypothetical protein